MVIDVEQLLTQVRKPSRYLGREINSVLKNWEYMDVKWCLAFPDAYEVGMSHLGLEIIYSILNSDPKTFADRAFTPWIDMEEAMRKSNTPLWGLNSRREVLSFDVLGITLPYELTYTNILTILDLAGIPFYSKDRNSLYPLIIGGGSTAFNPEPIADIFDCILLGDGEEAVQDINRLIQEWKREGLRDKDVLLKRMVQIKGVYVPSLCSLVNKACVSDINKIPYIKDPIVPFMKVIHDRVGVEIQRGCTRGCRFCQAGFVYRPVRQRDAENIGAIVDRCLASSGHEDLSFLSLSAGDHEELPNILKETANRYKDQWINMSLPSLRIETLTPDILSVLNRSLNGGFTLAPEAATMRLRRIINKGNTEEDLLLTIDKVFQTGWRLLKLYFMIGLPTETDEDVHAIADLVHKAMNIGKKYRRDITITVSISTFVPKPHTPFQWAPQIGREETIQKQHILKDETRRRGIELKWHNSDMSFLEGVFARGDRKLSKVIIEAWKNGARFDAWDDIFKFDIWMNAFGSCGIDAKDYVERERLFDEKLPWDHLYVELDKEFLKKEYLKAMECQFTPDCRTDGCQGCGISRVTDCTSLREVSSEVERRRSNLQAIALKLPGVTSLSFTYSKLGPAKWLSHLELMQVFRRAFKRAGLPVKYTEGFHPHMKLSLEKALKVGEESERENGRVEIFGTLTKEIETKMKDLLLPEGIKIISCVSA